MSMYLPGSGDVPEGKKPEIAYPCPWSYTLIGRSHEGIRAAVASIVGAREHELTEANTSPGGKYLSMRLELVVADEPDRLLLFERLAAHAEVRFVI